MKIVISHNGVIKSLFGGLLSSLLLVKYSVLLSLMSVLEVLGKLHALVPEIQLQGKYLTFIPISQSLKNLWGIYWSHCYFLFIKVGNILWIELTHTLVLEHNIKVPDKIFCLQIQYLLLFRELHLFQSFPEIFSNSLYLDMALSLQSIKHHLSLCYLL